MTYGQIAEKARRYSRMSESGVNDADVYALISDSTEQFGLDVHGLPLEDYPSIEATFDLYDNMAFHLTITGGANAVDSDVVVTDTNTNDMTGTEAAAELQSQIRAAGASTVTVSWSPYAFTVDSLDGTAISITEPSDSSSYSDATDLLFGGPASVAASSVTGGFPTGCTVECDLSADVVTIQQVFWDGYPLQQAPEVYFVEPRTQGTPAYYHIKGKKLRLYPAPGEQKRLVVRYKGIPTPTSVGDLNGSTSVDLVPNEYHMALCYFAASHLAAMNYEMKISDRYRYLYQKEVFKYISRYNNRITETNQDAVQPLWYRVVT